MTRFWWGTTLALIHNDRPRKIASPYLKFTPVLLTFLLIACSHPQAGWLNYLRSYAARMAAGSTLFFTGFVQLPRGIPRALSHIAGMSYALYVWHPLLAGNWLGMGETFYKYAKRPLLFAVLFAVAHVSTNHFEKHFTGWARRVTAKTRDRSLA